MFQEPHEIETAEGTFIHRVGKGSIDITVSSGKLGRRTVTLQDIVYVPEASSNLLSTTTLMDRGYEISMKRESGVKILKNGVLVASTIREGKLYRLRTAEYAKAAVQSPDTSSKEASIMI